MSRDYIIISGKCVVLEGELSQISPKKIQSVSVYGDHFVVKADYVQSAANSENSLLSAIDSV